MCNALPMKSRFPRANLTVVGVPSLLAVSKVSQKGLPCPLRYADLGVRRVLGPNPSRDLQVTASYPWEDWNALQLTVKHFPAFAQRLR